MESFTEVFSWGSDQDGQLGLGGTIGKTFPSPRLCSFNVLIKELSCGEEHSAFISNQGHIYTMGSNTEGRLGIDDQSVTFSSSPCLVSKLTDKNPVKLACGWGHTAVITESGELYTWGVGEFGALGLGSISTQWSPEKVSLFHQFDPIQVSCGSRHMAVLSKSGTVGMTGCGRAGQLGTHKREQENSLVLIDCKNVVQIACGVFHTVLLNSKGQVLTAGGNSFGQLGFGNKKSTSTFEQVKGLEGVYVLKVAAGYHSAAVSDNGELFVWGTGTFGEFLTPHKLYFQDRVKEVSIGGTFSVVYLQNQAVYAWGNNANGELGLNDYEPRTTPTLIPALKGKKINLLACGGNFCIALGNNVFGRSRTPGHVRSQSKVESITEKKTEIYSKKTSNHKVQELVQLDEQKKRNERLRLDLDESTSQNIRLKNRSASIENGYRAIENENFRLKEENQQLLIRLQEIQPKKLREDNGAQGRDLKLLRDENFMLQNRVQELMTQAVEVKKIREENMTQGRDLKLLRDENFMLQNRVQELMTQTVEVKKFREENMAQGRDLKLLRDENFMLQSRVQELMSQVAELPRLKDENQQLLLRYQESQAQYKERHLVELELSKKDLQEERLKVKTIELNYQMLSEENSKLLKQSEHLFNELSRTQHDKEDFHCMISSKDGEIERISKAYHELLIQINRLAEENKIFRATNLELEEKNKKLFDNLEKELAARAHDYKERTLSILATPLGERENKKSVSPIRTASISPNRVVSRTENISRTKLSEVTQTKIGNTAARMLARMENESALGNLRVSSPGRRSPERPVPYKAGGVSKEIREILRSKLQEYRE
jgi:alpha-tubulin suppressor-like RCC1 family protein